MENDPAIRIDQVLDQLPAGFETLCEAARAEGHGFLDRLAADWAAGAMRFDREGEILLAAFVHGELAGIGGLTIEPVVPSAMRMRRFYVRPEFRRGGIGRTLALTLRDRALARGRSITLNASRESVAFWEALGFIPDARDGHTHLLNPNGR